MPRCSAWRPVLEVPAEHLEHEPGRCRTCWFPCRDHVEPGVVICAMCESLLSRHPSVRVRSALARHRDTSEATLHYLMSDGDFNVVLAATEALAARDGSHLFDDAIRSAATKPQSGKEMPASMPDGWR